MVDRTNPRRCRVCRRRHNQRKTSIGLDGGPLIKDLVKFVGRDPFMLPVYQLCWRKKHVTRLFIRRKGEKFRGCMSHEVDRFCLSYPDILSLSWFCWSGIVHAVIISLQRRRYFCYHYRFRSYNDVRSDVRVRSYNDDIVCLSTF